MKGWNPPAVVNWGSHCVNTICLFSILSLAVLLRLDTLPTFHRGFFCNDASIRFPYKPELISTKFIIAISVPLPVLIIFLSEFIFSKNHGLVPTGGSSPLWLSRAFRLSILFIFGGVATAVLTDTGKAVLGWPRPNFIDVCRPNVTCDPLSMEFHEDYICLGDQKESLKARHSFPSGHASVTAYVAVFLSVYFQTTYITPTAFLLRPLLQLFVITLSWLAGLSRVSDNMHHGMDVIAGFILGVLVASFVLYTSYPYIESNCFSMSLNGESNLNDFLPDRTFSFHSVSGRNQACKAESRSRRTTMETTIT